tara:strand:+ start:87 stop:458 length:372 start_codon:yes stop_codon:yes gene_type:complete
MTINDFKYHYAIITGRCKSTRNTTDNHRKVHDLGFHIEYLKEIWDSQQGKCPITGQKLILKTYKTIKETLTTKHASIDRIDNGKGYVRGNIRFVSIMANYALNKEFNDEQLIQFCFNVVNSQE